MATVETVKEKLQGLIDRSNGVTGENHENLSDAVDALAAGYGQGGADDGVLMSVLDRTVTELVVPAGLKDLGLYSLYMCKKLKSLQLPDTLTMISMHAIRGCESLESLEIPASVTTVSAYAMAANTALKTVYFLGTPGGIVATAFNGCTALTDIYVPWAEGEREGAPWSATNATVHYNYTGEEA